MVVRRCDGYVCRYVTGLDNTLLLLRIVFEHHADGMNTFNFCEDLGSADICRALHEAVSYE